MAKKIKDLSNKVNAANREIVYLRQERRKAKEAVEDVSRIIDTLIIQIMRNLELEKLEIPKYDIGEVFFSYRLEVTEEDDKRVFKVVERNEQV